ncbi:MAG: hypothetical protein CMJ78_07810 [Planctomycetaceae bacterium]|nr:hypothetical protein [Planctomycetaceae bacterium]
MSKPLCLALCFVCLGCSEPMLRSSVDGPGPGLPFGNMVAGLDAAQSITGIPGVETRRVSDQVVRLQNELPPGDAERAAVTAQSGKRLIVYSAMFTVATANVDEAVIRFKKLIEQVGGYLEQRQNSQLVSRVPATHFDQVVDVLPELGMIRSQSIRNEDVTDQHRDLNLRIETAQWSRKRILALLERAEKIEDVLKLEEELRKLTEQIEGLIGKSKHLTNQIAYSTVEVAFVPKAEVSKVSSSGGSSLFPWINSIGADQVLAGFQNVVNGKVNETPVSAYLTGMVRLDLPDSFVVIDQQKHELKATTADNAKLWLREFVINKHAELEFWAKAVNNHLVENRGYELVEQQHIEDQQGKKGIELTFDTRSSKNRYTVMVFADEMKLLTRKRNLRVIEFVASQETFDSYITDIRIATTNASIARPATVVE